MGNDPDPTVSAAFGPRFPNWKKIAEYEEELKFFSRKRTITEQIVSRFYEDAILKNRKDPWNVPLHVSDYISSGKEEDEFDEYILRKTMEKSNRLGFTKKVHPGSGNYLINVAIGGLGLFREELLLLTMIKDQFPINNEERIDLESRLKKRNKVLQKYKRFRTSPVRKE